MIVKEFPITSVKRYPADESHKYPQVVVEIMTTDGLIKGYANDGNWNKDWIGGTKVKAGIEMATSKSGTKYAKLSCPPELKPKFGGSGISKDYTPTLEKILMELVAIRVLLNPFAKEQQKNTVDTPAQMPDPEPADAPAPEPEINVEDIPF